MTKRLVVLDIFSGQKTKSIFTLMKELDITAVNIPDGCTDYVHWKLLLLVREGLHAAWL